MAKQTIITLVDDLDGSEAQDTVAFSLDGVAYQIDLNAEHAAELREVMQPFVARARRAATNRKGR